MPANHPEFRQRTSMLGRTNGRGAERPSYATVSAKNAHIGHLHPVRSLTKGFGVDPAHGKLLDISVVAAPDELAAHMPTRITRQLKHV